MEFQEDKRRQVPTARMSDLIKDFLSESIYIGDLLNKGRFPSLPVTVSGEIVDIIISDDQSVNLADYLKYILPVKYKAFSAEFEVDGKILFREREVWDKLLAVHMGSCELANNLVKVVELLEDIARKRCEEIDDIDIFILQNLAEELERFRFGTKFNVAFKEAFYPIIKGPDSSIISSTKEIKSDRAILESLMYFINVVAPSSTFVCATF